MKKHLVVGLVIILFFSFFLIYKDSIFPKQKEEQIKMYIFKEGPHIDKLILNGNNFPNYFLSIFNFSKPLFF